MAYSYDTQGRTKTLTTWTNYTSTSGAATTTWNYDAYRGWLTNKVYPDATGPSFTYTPAGRLKTRTWARGVVTTYYYGFDGWGSNNYQSGDALHVEYSDGTPAVTYDYDRQGRPQNVICNSVTTAMGYYTSGLLFSESYGGRLLIFSYNQLRRSALWLYTNPNIYRYYTYDEQTGRLSTAFDGTNNAAYSYLANSALIDHITYTRIGATNMMTTARQYDNLNRLQAISSSPSMGLAVSFGYQYNNANQRTNAALADGSWWTYQYDALGQVTLGKRHWADNTLVPGQQFEYTHDDIGSRTQTKVGGDQSGAGLRPASYAANSLNQYSSRQVSTNVDVLGIANYDASVSVVINGSTNQNVYRHNDYFQAVGSAGNAGGPAWTPLSATVTRSTNTVQQPPTPPGHLLIPPAAQTFLYDADGNLTNDCVWSYTWDGENRLVAMDCLVSGPVAQHLSFEYDWQGRRARKVVRNANLTILTDTRFVYDGWNLVAELNSASQPIRTYLWGTDLSGTIQGAGGISGLLAINDATNGTHFVAYDGNGNVAALVRATDGTISARYEYGPFGELLRASGPMAMVNSFLFQTQFYDWETGKYYWKHRYYDASTGRWLSRDPIGEEGGNNLYAFALNCPTTEFDPNGQLVGKLKAGAIKYVGKTKIRTVGPFTTSDRAKAEKAMCLVRKLLPRTTLYSPYFPDVYWAVFTGGKPAHGWSVPASRSDIVANYWIFISAPDYQAMPETSVLGMVDFGVTLFHEADHYYTLSSDDEAGEPAERIDGPALISKCKAAEDRLNPSPTCDKHNPAWIIKTRLEQYACDCDINLGTIRAK